MRAFRLLLLISILMVIFACAPSRQLAEAPIMETNNIDNFEITKVADGEYLVTLKADKNLRYEVYEKKPDKLVLNIFEANLSKDVITKKYSDSFIQNLDFNPGSGSSRIIFTIKGPFSYEHNSEGTKINLTIKESNPDIAYYGKEEVNFEAVSGVSERLAKFVNSIENNSTNSDINLKISLDGIARYDYGYLSDTRMYIDVFDVRKKFSAKSYKGKGAVHRILVNDYYPPQKVRFVVDVAQKLPVFAGQKDGDLFITSDMGSAPKDQKYIATIDAVSYRGVQSVIVKFVGRVGYSKKIINSALHIELDDEVKMLGNVSGLQTFNKKPFKKVEVVKLEGKTVIVLVPNGDVFATVDETPEGLLISSSFEEFSKADLELAPKEIPVETIDSKIDRVVNSEMGKDVSSQDKVTVNFTDMDVREAIRLLFYGREANLVFGNEVKGKVTLFLKDVDYKTALNFIMDDQGLTILPKENIMWVISKNRKAEIAADEARVLKAKEDVQKLEPLETVILPVNFSTANELMGIVKSALSMRGKLELDGRTNSFVVKDTRQAINDIRKLLKSVDKRTPQVTIEARIVEVTDSNEFEIGIQWGGHWNKIDNSTTFPNSLNLTGGTDVAGNSGNYMVNLPVTSPAGALALTLGHSTGLFNLDVALSALETQDKAKTISNPRITTLDNMEAEIKSGNKAVIVPSGDNTDSTEVDVGIKLKVKPHITSNDMVFLDISVEKSTLGSITSTTATSDEKKALTKVLLANGETTVIGGLYEDERKDVTTGIPGFSKIPVLGWLFKGKRKIVTKRELLVFITPYVEK